jgi:hypothetical protein
MLSVISIVVLFTLITIIIILSILLATKKCTTTPCTTTPCTTPPSYSIPYSVIKGHGSHVHINDKEYLSFDTPEECMDECRKTKDCDFIDFRTQPGPGIKEKRCNLGSQDNLVNALSNYDHYYDLK